MWRPVGLAMLLTVPAAIPARTLPELERALARTPPQSTAFTEYRFSRLLKRAAVATGTLEYLESGTWIRTVDSPVRERAEIAADEVHVRRGDDERRFSLSRAPQLRVLLDSLRALLAGRITGLADEFEISLTSREDSWGLRLIPRDARLAKKVARIDVFGTANEVGCIEVAEPDGDASFTLLGAALAASPGPSPGPTPGEDTARRDRTRVESRCRTAPIEAPAAATNKAMPR